MIYGVMYGWFMESFDNIGKIWFMELCMGDLGNAFRIYKFYYILLILVIVSLWKMRTNGQMNV